VHIDDWVGLWMMLVALPFGCPFENFAFDDAGVGAESAYRVDAAQSFGDALIPQSDDCSVVMRGKKKRWGFRPQDRAWPALVGLEFVEGVLDFPALGSARASSSADASAGSRIVVSNR